MSDMKEYYVDAITTFKVRYTIKAPTARAAIDMFEASSDTDLDISDQVLLGEMVVAVAPSSQAGELAPDLMAEKLDA